MRVLRKCALKCGDRRFVLLGSISLSWNMRRCVTRRNSAGITANRRTRPRRSNLGPRPSSSVCSPSMASSSVMRADERGENGFLSPPKPTRHPALDVPALPCQLKPRQCGGRKVARSARPYYPEPFTSDGWFAKGVTRMFMYGKSGSPESIWCSSSLVWTSRIEYVDVEEHISSDRGRARSRSSQTGCRPPRSWERGSVPASPRWRCRRRCVRLRGSTIVRSTVRDPALTSCEDAVAALATRLHGTSHIRGSLVEPRGAN